MPERLHFHFFLHKRAQASLVVQWYRIRLKCRSCKKMHVQSLSWEDPHDEGMATYFSILACPMDRGVGVLQTIESQRARHD